MIADLEEQLKTNLIILMDDSGPLQQVVTDVASHHLAPGVEMDLDEFAKARRVVVPGSFGVAK